MKATQARAIALLLALGLMLTMVTGCQKKDNNTVPTPSEASSETPSEAPASTEPDPAPAEGETVSDKDTITIAIDREPASMDPGEVAVTVSRQIWTQIYDSLVDYDAEMNIIPSLAERWEQNDALTWTFYLRKGVLFHNGEEMKASDVVYSFDRLYDSAAGAVYVAEIDRDSLEAVDDYTFRFKTNREYAFVLQAVASKHLSVLSQKALEEKGADFSRDPVGTGAFAFEGWTAGDSITMTRNENYWGEVAKLNKVIFRIITEASSRTIDLEAGGIDISYQLPMGDADRIDASPDTTLIKHTYGYIRYMTFNCEAEPFDNIEVRKAFAHATDPEVIRTVCYPESEPAVSAVAPGYAGRNTDLIPYEYDPAKAKQMLADAGYPDGITVNFLYLSNSTNNMVVEILQEMWKEAGIELTLSPTESATLSTMLNKGEYQLCTVGTSYSMEDAGNELFRFFHSSMIGAVSVRARLSDPAVDAKLDEITATVDPEARAALVYEAQQLIHDQAAGIYIAHNYVLVGLRNDVRGFEITPTCYYRYNTVYFAA